MTTAHSTTSPTPEELQVWTEQVRDWFEETGRKRLPKEMREALLAQGAKYCYTCQTTKAVTEYNKCSSKADGLESKCKPCKNGSNAEHYAANRQERIEYQRRYHAEHAEELREYRRTRYATNELYRMDMQLRNGKRRTLEAGGVIEDFDAADLLDWWEQQGIPADRDYFTDEPLDPATRSVDHLWAVSKGGPHARWALVPTAPLTNQMKRSKSPSEFRDWLRSEGIEPAERPDPAPFLIEALANRAAEQSNEEIDPLVARAMSTSAPVRAKRTLLVQIEEGADNE